MVCSFTVSRLGTWLCSFTPKTLTHTWHIVSPKPDTSYMQTHKQHYVFKQVCHLHYTSAPRSNSLCFSFALQFLEKRGKIVHSSVHFYVKSVFVCFIYRKPILLGFITNREYCQCKKVNRLLVVFFLVGDVSISLQKSNRFKLPVGAKFYRLSARQYVPKQVSEGSPSPSAGKRLGPLHTD